MCNESDQLTRYCLLAAVYLSSAFVESLMCPVSADTAGAVDRFVPELQWTSGDSASIMEQPQQRKLLT